MVLRLTLLLFTIAAVSACDRCEIAPGPMPPLLSGTGCVDMKDPTRPIAGIIPYDINEPFWSDGAEKHRFLALPADTRIEIDQDGDFAFPVGAVLIKHFRVDGRFIETRFFMRRGAGDWSGYSYQWNDEATEAHLLNSAREAAVGNQTWFFPGGEHCLHCHTAAAGYSLGLEVAQLNRNHAYAPAGRPVNQLDYLQSQDVLGDVPPGLRQSKLASSRDPARTLDDRARAWLHSNCSHCHRPGGGTESIMDLRAGVALADMNLCEARPLLGTLGIADARLLAPGDHARSVLWARVSTLNPNRMPPLTSRVIDAAGADLIGEWVDSLTDCGPGPGHLNPIPAPGASKDRPREYGGL